MQDIKYQGAESGLPINTRELKHFPVVDFNFKQNCIRNLMVYNQSRGS